jgi:hypothetical protein|tara:strand:- start:205 stop:432 length:228 start_codon:yes stop_codon:yes gene_type:complete
MPKKNTKSKPTRKDIENALGYIGQKLAYLEKITVTTENLIDAYINFKDDKDKFLKYLEKTFPVKEKELEKAPKNK